MEIGIQDGRIYADGMVVGTIVEEEYSLDDGYKVEPVIVLNAAWLKMAGVHVRVLADPEVDRKRDGKLLDR